MTEALLREALKRAREHLALYLNPVYSQLGAPTFKIIDEALADTASIDPQPSAGNGDAIKFLKETASHITAGRYLDAKAALDRAYNVLIALPQASGMTEAMCEIINRAANFADADAADWMPSIYKIACEAVGRDPWPMLEANGWKRDQLTVSLSRPLSARGE